MVAFILTECHISAAFVTVCNHLTKDSKGWEHRLLKEVFVFFLIPKMQTWRRKDLDRPILTPGENSNVWSEQVEVLVSKGLLYLLCKLLL